MRPPEFTGGNQMYVRNQGSLLDRFNEAAGIHRRKQSAWPDVYFDAAGASMRPPEFTGGNLGQLPKLARGIDASMRPPEFTGGNPTVPGCPYRVECCFNEAAGIHRRETM